MVISTENSKLEDVEEKENCERQDNNRYFTAHSIKAGQLQTLGFTKSTAIIARKVPANARNLKSGFRCLLPPFSAQVREQLKKLQGEALAHNALGHLSGYFVWRM